MLYIVATPIGNLEDISERSRRILAEAEYVCAEDTRKTGLLLKRLGIGKKKLISFYEHNEQKRLAEVVSLLSRGASVALVSSAGTPLISDPGFKLVRRCGEENIPVSAVPGPCAAINALVLSGLATDSFFFAGFLPRKKAQLVRKLGELAGCKTTLVFYESPFRLEKLLLEAREVLGNREAAVIREMTKIHEQVISGNIDQVLDAVRGRRLRGEITVVIDNRF